MGLSVISLSNPPKTDTAIIKAATPMAFPATDIVVIKDIKLDSFLDLKNLFAKKKFAN